MIVEPQPRAQAARPLEWGGVVAALLIIGTWTGLLTWLLLGYHVAFDSALTWLLVLPMTHLYTGLFISAHDAMHGTLAPGRPALNRALGTVTALLFAFNWYDRLLPRHHAHHRHVATEHDPDFHDGQHPGFLPWLLRFAWNYVTWWQVLAMAVTYNVGKLAGIPMQNLILYWIAPAVLATIQLFYFGTWRPHRGEHAPHNRHHARSQRRQHVWAFLTCYFFGYHYEHHEHPAVPWWRLWRTRATD
jgi:beta-carotene/zeaxanthin 4-ketolase